MPTSRYRPTRTSPGRSTTGPPEPVSRALPVAAACVVLSGAILIVAALVAAPGPWSAGYVSEAGTADRPFAVAYRIGVIVLAAGVALLGLAVHRPAPLAAALLGLAAGLAAVSGSVACTSQCPLPPFEPTTVPDVVHAAAAIAGMVTLAAAMGAIMLSSADHALRRLAAVGAVLTVPTGAALGLTMLLVGRGALVAALERILLAIAVSWLVGTSGLLTVLRNSVKVEE
jgi:Protein of unknown function (DUF998)